MNVIEERYMKAVKSSLRDIARQMEIANKLSALKLKTQLDGELLCADALDELNYIMKG